MRRLAAAILAFGLIGSAALASAADIEGKVRSVDASARTFVLDDGTELSLADGVQADKLKDGANVKASYEDRDGKKVVTSIEVSE